MRGQLERGSWQLSKAKRMAGTPGHFGQMQLTAEELTAPVLRGERRETKIGVMYLYLAPTVPRRGVRWLIGVDTATNNLPR
jgi:hypothetical protein